MVGIGLGSLSVSKYWLDPPDWSPYRQIVEYELRCRKKSTMSAGDDRLNTMMQELKTWETVEARQRRARFYAKQKLQQEASSTPLDENQLMAIALRSLERNTNE